MTSRRTAFTCWRRRSTSSRCSSASAPFFTASAKICAQGGLVILAGRIDRRTGDYAAAWSMVVRDWSPESLYCWVPTISLSCRDRRADQPEVLGPKKHFLAEFLKTFGTFFQKPKIIPMLVLPSALPARRGATGEDGAIVPSGLAARRAGWAWPRMTSV